MTRSQMIIAGVLTAGLLVLVAAMLITGAAAPGSVGGAGRGIAAEAPDRWQAPDRSFSVALPAGWTVEHGAAATVLQRGDRRGALVVRRGGELRESPRAVARGLERSLRRRLGDIRPLRTSALTTDGREGLLYTFTRPAVGTVQSIAVVPAADATFTLDAVVAGADEHAAREVGAIVRSFDPA